MDHIEIYVSDLGKTREFYDFLLIELLGFEQFQEWELGFSYIKDGFYIVFVKSKKKDKAYNRTDAGLNHLAFNISSEKSLDNLRNQCK